MGLLLFGYKFFVSVFGVTYRVSWAFHELAEVTALLSLLLGTLCSFGVLWWSLKQQDQMQTKLTEAAGEFHEIIVVQFEKWGFSEAESSIGLLLIKGLSIAEIADLRGRSQATIKAQNTSIYNKSGMANRAQLVSYFVEEIFKDF